MKTTVRKAFIRFPFKHKLNLEKWINIYFTLNWRIYWFICCKQLHWKIKPNKRRLVYISNELIIIFEFGLLSMFMNRSHISQILPVFQLLFGRLASGWAMIILQSKNFFAKNQNLFLHCNNLYRSWRQLWNTFSISWNNKVFCFICCHCQNFLKWWYQRRFIHNLFEPFWLRYKTNRGKVSLVLTSLCSDGQFENCSSTFSPWASVQQFL